MAKIIGADEFVLCATNCGSLYPKFVALARFTKELPYVSGLAHWALFYRNEAKHEVLQECYRGERVEVPGYAAEEAVKALRNYYHEHLEEGA